MIVKFLLWCAVISSTQQLNFNELGILSAATEFVHISQELKPVKK